MHRQIRANNLLYCCYLVVYYFWAWLILIFLVKKNFYFFLTSSIIFFWSLFCSLNSLLMSLFCCSIEFNTVLSSLLLFSDSYGAIHSFLNTFFGKFIIIAIIWSFIFQSLCEIRHLFWDLGFGFELKTSNITGLIVIFGSFVLTILIPSF